MSSYAREKFKVGDIVKLNTREDIGDFSNYYFVMAYGTYFGNKSRPSVVYRSLADGFKVFIQPISDFMARINAERHPNATAEFKFDKVIHINDLYDKANLHAEDSFNKRLLTRIVQMMEAQKLD